MSQVAVVILTESRDEQPTVGNQSIRNLLAECLKQRERTTQRVDWRADVDRSSVRAAVFRST